MLAFEDLSADVALLILSWCDIATVLSMGQVNRFFHELCVRKQLWIVLLEDLITRNLVDRPHFRSLSEHSVQELIALVRRTVVGPATWCPQDTPPTPAEEIPLPPSFITAHSVELLPGGQYLLVVRLENSIELWNVKATTPVWTTISHRDAKRAIEILDGGRSVVLCLWLLRDVTVIQVNLETGESYDLLSIRVPEARGVQVDDTVQGLNALAISAELLACGLYYSINNTCVYAILLINWRTQQYVVIWYPRAVLHPLLPSIALPRGHIIFTVLFGETFLHRVVDFESRWRHVSKMGSEFDRPMDWRAEIAPRVIARFGDIPAITPEETSEDVLGSPELVLYRSPLRHDTYKLLVSYAGITTDFSHPYPYFRVVLGYGFSVARDTCALDKWERTSANRAATSGRTGSRISYAGYTLETVHDNLNIVALCPAVGGVAHVVLKTENGFPMVVAGYSHACVRLRDSAAAVSYYA
ncbi:hypothetical protein K438DRAFT_1968758 [Mycena galopus ATCC 62051]|nr:hypothetical protein K438DRAFT_1968758 [Mycena galopus ATCC 62051]